MDFACNNKAIVMNVSPDYQTTSKCGSMDVARAQGMSMTTLETHSRVDTTPRANEMSELTHLHEPLPYPYNTDAQELYRGESSDSYTAIQRACTQAFSSERPWDGAIEERWMEGIPIVPTGWEWDYDENVSHKADDDHEHNIEHRVDDTLTTRKKQGGRQYHPYAGPRRCPPPRRGPATSTDRGTGDVYSVLEWYVPPDASRLHTLQCTRATSCELEACPSSANRSQTPQPPSPSPPSPFQPNDWSHIPDHSHYSYTPIIQRLKDITRKRVRFQATYEPSPDDVGVPVRLVERWGCEVVGGGEETLGKVFRKRHQEADEDCIVVQIKLAGYTPIISHKIRIRCACGFITRAGLALEVVKVARRVVAQHYEQGSATQSSLQPHPPPVDVDRLRLVDLTKLSQRDVWKPRFIESAP